MSQADTGHNRVPFAEVVEPLRFMGAAVYAASAAAVYTIARSFNAIAKGLKARKTVSEVSQLSDHLLKDIGVQRYELESLARRAAENPGIDYRVLRR